MARKCNTARFKGKGKAKAKCFRICKKKGGGAKWTKIACGKVRKGKRRRRRK